MAASEEDVPPPRLPELFARSQALLEELETATEPSGSHAIQDKVKKGLELLQKGAEMLSQLDVFGQNEDVEELASADLKYLLVPAFQGTLTLRLVEPNKRLEHLKRAREYFEHFLRRCHSYRVPECPLPPPPPPPQPPAGSGPEVFQPTSGPASPDLVAMAGRRQAKIERYLRKKEAEQGLSVLRAAVEGGEADDERVREYHLLLLRRWAHVALEELESIDQETQILAQRGSPGDPGASAPRPATRDRPPLRPFVLTRSTAQAKVFGAGYPSLATVTVNEWYEQQQQNDPEADSPQEPARVEELETEEDEQKELQRAQEWDDWKDTHPRGYGNRQNMG